MSHTRLEKWEGRLKKILDEVDDILEDQLGNRYRLHPARAKRGKTSNKSQDGLFNITASFTLGIGSKYKRGYVIDVHLSTLEKVSPEIKNKINKIVTNHINKKLPEYFPERELNIGMDGNIIKIWGNLSLGKL